MMELSSEEAKAMLPAVFVEVCHMTRIDRGGELLPKGKERLRVLRGILRKLLVDSGMVLSKEEDHMAGLI